MYNVGTRQKFFFVFSVYETLHSETLQGLKLHPPLDTVHKLRHTGI